MALMPVADALKAVLEGASGLPEELVALDDARGRVLARDLTAMRTQPPDDMSAMDGYAVRAADATLVGAAEGDRRGRGRPAVRAHGAGR